MRWERNATRQTSVLVLIFKGMGEVKNCNTYREVKMLEHAMKIAERVLERIRELVNIDLMPFGFILGRRTTDTLLVVRRMQEEYRDKKNEIHVFCGY